MDKNRKRAERRYKNQIIKRNLIKKIESRIKSRPRRYSTSEILRYYIKRQTFWGCPSGRRCSYCASGRIHKFKVQEERMKDELKESSQY